MVCPECLSPKKYPKNVRTPFVHSRPPFAKVLVGFGFVRFLVFVGYR